MRRVIIKQGPIVFLKNVLFMEVVAIFVFFGLSFVENYELLYKNMNLEDYLRYDLFIILASALFQFFYIIFLFINWYFSYFEINENEVIKKTGVIFSTKKSFSTHNVVSLETHQSIFDRAIGHADLIINYPKEVKLHMRNVPNFDENLHLLKQFIKSSLTKKSESLTELLENGENIEIEFKESLRFDKLKKQLNKELEKVVMKTLVGFLNTEGGTLLIGVSNEGEVVGLADDFATLQRKNADGFENHLTLLFKNYIGVAFIKYIDIGFEKTEGKEVCIVKVKPSHKPVFLKSDEKREDFFIRAGNSTQPLLMSEADEYIRNHFK